MSFQGYVGAVTQFTLMMAAVGDHTGPIKMRISWGKGIFSCRYGMNKKLPSETYRDSFISNKIRIPEAEPISIFRWFMSCQGSTLKRCAVALEVDLRLIHCINFLSRDARQVVPTVWQVLVDSFTTRCHHHGKLVGMLVP